MVTQDREHSQQDLCEGLSRLVGPEFSAAELSAIASELPEAVHPELVDSRTLVPVAPSAVLGKAVLEALVYSGIFDSKFGSAVMKDEFDAPSRESVDELYALTAESQKKRSI